MKPRHCKINSCHRLLSHHISNEMLFSLVYFIFWGEGPVMVVIVCQLDLQLLIHVQSVSITTNVMSSNSAQTMCTRYNIM